jgi:uncharacterized protein GlcG (DUF336 family)
MKIAMTTQANRNLEGLPLSLIGQLAGLCLALSASSCGVTTNSASSTTASSPALEPVPSSVVLTAADVQSIVQATASAVNVPLVIAVTDRSGNVLAIYNKANAPASATGNLSMVEPSDQVAVSLAMSTSFFSNDQAPISTRTIRYISASHFPPGIANTSSGPLYGIENTNRGCGFNVNYLPGQSLPVPRALAGGPGLGILTGKPTEVDTDTDNFVVNPGGVPIFKSDPVTGAPIMVGGVGVAGTDPATAEYAAFAGAFSPGFGGTFPVPGAVFVNGIALPFVMQTTIPAGEGAGTADGSYEVPPQGSLAPTPEGDLIAETGSTMGGLTLAQVQTIVQNTIATANLTRAVIRLPEGARTKFAIAVADLNGNLLALYRMHDATMFSTDVAVAKARNVIYFSTATGELNQVPAGTAVTNRTIGFGAQPLYPSGIDGTAPGPFFDLFQFDTANPCTQGHQLTNSNQNGIVFFPGSVPLFVNGKLAGGLGVSGDGVDQDDWAAAGGANGFQAPDNIRADQIIIRNVRLPYQKFPRNPED